MKKIITASLLLMIGMATYYTYGVWSRPSIELAGISADTVVSMQDTLAVNIKFQDRDGDIGDSVPGMSKAYIEDTAYHVVQELPIISRASIHTMGEVAGRLRLLVDLLPLLDTVMQRNTRLKLYITDRKGHKSNVVETSQIHLSRKEY